MPTDTKNGTRQKPATDQAGFWFAYFKLSLAEGQLDAAAKAHAELRKLGITIQIGPPQPQGSSDTEHGGGAQ